MRRLKVDPIRENILNILVKIDSHEGYINVLLNNTLEKNKVIGRDAAFINEITYGVTRNRNRLDWIISQYSTKKVYNMSILIRNILRMSIYQLLFLSKVPNYAVCNESVQLAKKYGNAKTANFTNAILRNILRKKNEINWPNKEKDPVLFIAVIYSHPDWIIRRWIKRFGFESTIEICKANNKIPPLTVRTNTLKIKPSDLRNIFKKEEGSVEKGAFTEEALYVKGISNIVKSSAFKEGLFQIQDESSILVSRLVNPSPGDFIIDICSAPGGKTTHLAQLMKNKGTIIAMDINRNKLKTV
ncbi:MAG: transcription antitermination factor NusB, partial [Candidatus Caldatribacteriota bacterium]|nr:transcription antitermination factor NusB [Candidatus Caldatribacteriota bacterium]